MSDVGFILDRLAEHESPVLFWHGQAYSGSWICQQARRDIEYLQAEDVRAGDVVLLEADYSARTVAMLLALAELRTILVPLLHATLAKLPSLVGIANPSFQISVDNDGNISVSRRDATSLHPLMQGLRDSGSPGLLLFTSGSTGQPKAALHHFGRLLAKFRKPRPALRTLNFLLFDHWGGLNTLFHCLANLSPVVLPEDRSANHICDLMERYQVELLPASPTFLNMLLLSRAYEGRDLSSLRLITYGSEPMPPVTLARLREVFPTVELRQTYGLIELGVLRAKSESSDSLWVKLGGEGYELRVVDGILQIKAESAMLGYLNAPSPFTEDGYFVTGDRVEQNGDHLRILGRESELINVGGLKVFPAEVESVLLTNPLVEDAVVYGERHPITGKIVCADIKLRDSATEAEARRTLKGYCAQRLEPFKVPVKLKFVQDALHSDRLKRSRLGRQSAAPADPTANG
jgi:long-chain acyl-CoA synthetase